LTIPNDLEETLLGAASPGLVSNLERCGWSKSHGEIMGKKGQETWENTWDI
jgi:hypothetical protein